MFNESNDVTIRVSKDLEREGYVVALNKKNPYKLPVFHSSGTQNSVPDLFFYMKGYEDLVFRKHNNLGLYTNFIVSGFVELKKGDKLINIFRGVSQLCQYWSYYTTDQCRFFYNGKEIKYIQAFLLGTYYSFQGMLYRGDEMLEPQSLTYISDVHDVEIYPYTHAIHSSLRERRREKLTEIKTKGLKISKKQVDLGVVFAKVSKFGDYISDEYWAWLGNRMKPLKKNAEAPCIQVKLRIVFITDKAIKVNNTTEESIWIPKSILMCVIREDDIGTIKKFVIPLWFYSKNQWFFGLI